jgi:hypothetical protein
MRSTLWIRRWLTGIGAVASILHVCGTKRARLRFGVLHAGRARATNAKAMDKGLHIDISRTRSDHQNWKRSDQRDTDMPGIVRQFRGVMD